MSKIAPEVTVPKQTTSCCDYDSLHTVLLISLNLLYGVRFKYIPDDFARRESCRQKQAHIIMLGSFVRCTTIELGNLFRLVGDTHH